MREYIKELLLGVLLVTVVSIGFGWNRDINKIQELDKELEYKENWIYNQELLIESLENDIYKYENSEIITNLMLGRYSYYDLEIVYNLINKTPLIQELARYDFNYDGVIDWNDYFLLERYLEVTK